MLRDYLNCSLLFVLLFASGSASADHLPEGLLAMGKPEVELAGINLETSKLEDVIHIFGQPTHKVKATNNPSWTGYEWDLSRGRLELDVDEGPKGPEIHDIYIAGAFKKEPVKTGQGLKIGGTLADLKRIYGDRFELSAQNTNPSQSRDEFTGVQEANEYRVATIQWQSWDFTLRAGFGADGKIDAMWLILPECYPDGCN